MKQILIKNSCWSHVIVKFGIRLELFLPLYKHFIIGKKKRKYKNVYTAMSNTMSSNGQFELIF